MAEGDKELGGAQKTAVLLLALGEQFASEGKGICGKAKDEFRGEGRECRRGGEWGIDEEVRI